MTKLLAVDASTELCSVAVICGQDMLQRSSTQPKSHARRLLPMVDELLAEAGIALSQLDGIAFGAGPGSFTGLRICVGVVQGLGFAADLPLVPVSSLQAMAQAEYDNRKTPWVVTLLDARMNEVYWSAYRVDSEGPAEVLSQRVTPVAVAENELRQWLAARSDAENWVGVGSGLAVLPNGGAVLQIRDADALPTASAVATLGMRELRRGNTVTAELAEPIYLRNEITWQKRPPARR